MEGWVEGWTDGGAAGRGNGGNARPRRPIDIEALLQWAYQRHRARYLPWSNPAPAALAWDHGWTAAPRRRAGFEGQAAIARRRLVALDEDAERVVAQVALLAPREMELVRGCAEGAVRPNWLPGIEPRLVARKVSWRRRRRRGGHRAAVVQEWKPCHPDAIRAARQAYRDWWAAVEHLRTQLASELKAWEIIGFAAPGEPWAEKSACNGPNADHHGAAQDLGPLPAPGISAA